MSEPELLAETRRWLSYADQDIHDAETLLSARTGFRNACFLAQQCAEKALKAILVWEGRPVPFSHDLEYLTTLIPEGWELPDLRVQALTEWATSGRYPGSLPDPTAPYSRARGHG